MSEAKVGCGFWVAEALQEFTAFVVATSFAANHQIMLFRPQHISASCSLPTRTNVLNSTAMEALQQPLPVKRRNLVARRFVDTRQITRHPHNNCCISKVGCSCCETVCLVGRDSNPCIHHNAGAALVLDWGGQYPSWFRN